MIINVMISTMNHFILKMATILIMMNVIIMIDTIKTITIENDYRHSNHDQQNDNHDYHDSNFDKTTNLYKELTDSNIDQDVLFKALMLYARENNKGVYDRYNRSSQHRHDDELRD